VNLSEDPKASQIAILGIVGAVLTFAAIVWLQALFVHVEQREIRTKHLARAPEELARLRAEQLEALHSYRWVDEKSGVVSIPIEEAMKLVARGSEEGRAPATPGDGRERR
jgi:hypothetical protein